MRLPRPGSNAIKDRISNGVTREIYRALYENRTTPLSIHDIREMLGPDAGIQQHLDRRLRELDRYFLIERRRSGPHTTYLLRARKPDVDTEGGISKTTRAWVLRDQRCAQCGRTPSEDGVKLHVDHKVPRDWGGADDPENLQALCSECNEGKKNYFASIEAEAPEILEAFSHDEVHRRIGEALTAAYPKKLRGDLLERVASAKRYQEDWQKRLRELRLLGWKIKATRQNEQGRSVAYYQLETRPPRWPKGRIRAAIRDAERKRGY